MGPTLLLRSFSHPGGSVLALDVVSPESPLPFQSHACLDLLLFVLGAGWLGLLPLAWDWLGAGSTVLPKSFARPGFTLLVVRLAHSDPMPLLQSLSSLEVSSFAFGAA